MNNSLFDAEEDKENVNHSLKTGLNSGREPFAVKANEVCGKPMNVRGEKRHKSIGSTCRSWPD